EDQLEALAAARIEPALALQDDGRFLYLFTHDLGFAPPRVLGTEVYQLTETTDLYLVPADLSLEMPHTKPFGGFRGVPRIGLPPIAAHEADKNLAVEPRPLTVNPLITQILAATSQANWFQDVKDLSGENTVIIGGQTRTILTRYS